MLLKSCLKLLKISLVSDSGRNQACAMPDKYYRNRLTAIQREAWQWTFAPNVNDFHHMALFVQKVNAHGHIPFSFHPFSLPFPLRSQPCSPQSYNWKFSITFCKMEDVRNRLQKFLRISCNAIQTLTSHHSIWSSRSVMAPIFTLLSQTEGFYKKKGLWMNIGRYVQKKMLLLFTSRTKITGILGRYLLWLLC